MPIGQADLENAVREGWIRDEDDELSIDGYSATIQLSTNDGTSGLNVKNSTGAVSFSAKSNGDGYFANKVGIGTENPEVTLEVIGKVRTNELQIASGAVAGYVLTSDGDGNSTWAPSTASGGVSDATFQENKTAQEEINDTILSSLDGYALDSTVTENKNTQEQINQSILQALDGYASDITVSEHYQQFSQAVQDVISTIDGYSTDAEFAGLTNTVTENNNAQQQINQSVLQALDGYASVPDTSATGDGYIAFFTDGERNIAGDNDLYFDRTNNQLQVSALKLTTGPNDGYVITSDSVGNATWQENPGNPARHRELDQLAHNIAETSYETYTYSAGQVTNITIWTNSEMVTKIREEQFTYSEARVSTVVTIQYNHLGIATETITENYTYSGNQVIDVTRTLT